MAHFDLIELKPCGECVMQCLATLQSLTSRQSAEVVCYRSRWPGGDVDAWVDCCPNPSAEAAATGGCL